MIQCQASGIVYRNPKPHLRSVHAWHPSLVVLDQRTLLASFDLGEAVESLNYGTWLARSDDLGATWQPPAPLFYNGQGLSIQGRRCSHSVRLGRDRAGKLVALGALYYRDDPEQGLTNRQNLGFVPLDLVQLSSVDQGRTWSGPNTVTPPLVGPAFEICHSLVDLADGRWLWPMSTWRGWDGSQPNGMRAIALVSRDQGRTWSESIDVVDQTRDGILTWEQSLVPLSDGRLLAVVWSFHESSGSTRPTLFALANDGRSFGAPRPNGIQAQTAKLVSLPDNHVLCAYRRNDQPGLWAELARIEGQSWTRLDESCLWQGAASGMRGVATPSDELGALKFGYPSLARLHDGSVLVLFWCLEEGVHNIRWLRLSVA